MKNFFLLIYFTLSTLFCFAQTATYKFDPGPDQPYGLPNPEAPAQILDWADLIGECSCKFISRNSDGTWADTTDMTWRFKYIMDGHAVQDETLKADGKHSGSIRQFIADSARWYVHYYSSAGPTSLLSTWEGNKKEDGNIILYRKQKAPNGTDGFYKIKFADISPKGFNWYGAWVNVGETISYPTWNIHCTKSNNINTKKDLVIIKQNIKKFSATYMNGDAAGLANMYTTDGKIFPGNLSIQEGTESLEKFWTIDENTKILLHEVQPKEIKIFGNYAYDYGHYSGKVENEKGEQSDFAGKYVIIWRKTGEDWKIYLDIWNKGV